MTIQLYAFACGFTTLPTALLLEGQKGISTVPILSFLIVHPRGKVVFDTGVHPALIDDQAAYLGVRHARVQQVQLSASEQIDARLEAADIDPGSIDLVINSHLHFDHCGGNVLLPNADIVVQRREVEHARSANGGYFKHEWDTGQRLKTIDGEHDLFGDGSVVIFPSYGHPPGHQSVRVQTELGGEFILCGDACYLKDTLDDLHLPGIVDDKGAMMEVLHRFRQMQLRGATMLRPRPKSVGSAAESSVARWIGAQIKFALARGH